MAIHQDQVNTVGPADLIPGVTTPAAPGEYIILYGTGFGATDPPLTAGQIPTSAYPDGRLTRLASTDVRVAFGDIEVAPTDIFYIGGAPCCAGLYQLTVKVPDNAPNGELPRDADDRRRCVAGRSVRRGAIGDAVRRLYPVGALGRLPTE